MEKITKLKSNEIFVFGSNLAGKHGKGGAKNALKWGAKYGVGMGLSGNTYAIPTKDYNINTLPLTSITEYVKTFIDFTILNPQYTFLVTEIGCGLAGYKVNDIAPMFKSAISLGNVKLPDSFLDYHISEISEKLLKKKLMECNNDVFWQYIGTWLDPSFVMQYIEQWSSEEVDFNRELNILEGLIATNKK